MKRAIVLTSFGTTYPDTREKNIEALAKDIQVAFPDFDFYQAYTSSIVRKRVKKQEGLLIPSVEDCLEDLLNQSYDQVFLQASHIIPGKEYHKIVHASQEDRFSRMDIMHSTPLLYHLEDYEAIVDHYSLTFSHLNVDEAVLFMGHGTDSQSFTSYVALNDMFRASGIYLACVEGYPGLDLAISRFKEDGIQKIHLYPFMLVAGDHANQDMVGKSKDTWEGQLRDQSFEVRVYLQGLGEDPFIRQSYVKKLRECISSSTNVSCLAANSLKEK